MRQLVQSGSSNQSKIDWTPRPRSSKRLIAYERCTRSRAGTSCGAPGAAPARHAYSTERCPNETIIFVEIAPLPRSRLKVQPILTGGTPAQKTRTKPIRHLLFDQQLPARLAQDSLWQFPIKHVVEQWGRDSGTQTVARSRRSGLQALARAA